MFFFLAFPNCSLAHEELITGPSLMRSSITAVTCMSLRLFLYRNFHRVRRRFKQSPYCFGDLGYHANGPKRSLRAFYCRAQYAAFIDS